MMANKQAPPPPPPQEPVPNVFVPLHRRQASHTSHSSRHSSENGRFDMPEYMNAARDENKPLSASGSYVSAAPAPVTVPDPHFNLGGAATSMNPAYGNLPNGKVSAQGSLAVDDLPPPPPPTVTEENELPFYSGINKTHSLPRQGPPTPVTVVNKKEKKTADSVLYTQQSIKSNGGGGHYHGGSSTTSQESTLISSDHEDVHQRRQFVRTLFCVLFVLFIMSAVSLGLCVYLLLNWPSSDCSTCPAAVQFGGSESGKWSYW